MRLPLVAMLILVPSVAFADTDRFMKCDIQDHTTLYYKVDQMSVTETTSVDQPFSKGTTYINPKIQGNDDGYQFKHSVNFSLHQFVLMSEGGIEVTITDKGGYTYLKKVTPAQASITKREGTVLKKVTGTCKDIK